MFKNCFIHESSIVDSNVEIGEDTKIWHWSHISQGVKIGKNCTIGQNVYIGKNVSIGNNVKIQNNVSIYEGVTIGNNVFLGPSCVFTNDKFPEINKEWKLIKTMVEDNCSIGANATIVCGNTIKKNTLIGAGSVLTKNTQENGVYFGNPAVLYKFKK